MSDQSTAHRLGWFDSTLVVVFLIGLYLNLSLQITPKIPLTCAPSGVAGMILLWRQRDRMKPAHLGGLMLVIVLYIGSILSAADYSYLGKRFTGLLQISYSLVISYVFFVTLVHSERKQIARILLAFCLLILIGVVLEQYTGLRQISDWVRTRLYDASQVYDADLRDQVLYGRVRPNLFTSEPSNVTFGYTHYAFTWLVVSTWRWKLAGYAVLAALALALMRGPTLLLMLMLAVPYLIFLAGRDREEGRRMSTATRLMGGDALSAILVVAAIVIGSSLYAERLREFSTGNDPSTFTRVTGPMQVAFAVFEKHPWAGTGLTGEGFIEDEALTIYSRSGNFRTEFFPKISEALTNYFWLHWIYLGLVWGTIIFIAMSLWLRTVGATSVAFCWAIWLIFGQASGAYVGPRTWSVLFIAAAGSILACRVQQTGIAGAGEIAVSRRPTALASLVAARREKYG